MTDGSNTRIGELQREIAGLRSELVELRLRSPSGREDVIHRLLRDGYLLENLPAFVTVMDREYRILYLNRTVPGRRVEEMIGTSALVHIPCDQHGRYCELFEQAWRSGVPCNFEVNTLSDLWWESRFVPMSVGGEVVCILGTSVEVTQRRRAERALRESERHLRLALDAAGMGTWVWTAATDQLSWDDTTCQIFGVATPHLPQSLGEYLELVHPDDRCEVRLAMARGNDSGIYEDLEHRIVRPDGELRHVFSKGTIIRDEAGRMTGFRGGVIDISARKRLEEQLNQAQKMKGIGQLTAGIAHNFNNLLSVILPNVALARHSQGNELAHCLEDIDHAAQRAADMVQQLMLFARPDTTLQPLSFDPGVSVRRTVQICRNTFDRSIRIELEIPDDLPQIAGNPGQFEQVLLNVCINARDALEATVGDRGHDQEDAWIRLEVERAAAGGISIAISDNGSGMDESTRRRVFEPFFTTKAVGRGTGLGLASAYAIVSEHRGRIRCESRLGVGTTFEIVLPGAAQLNQDAAPTPQFEPLPRANETVLLIDDEPLVRRAASAMLTYGGYRVLEAEDGRSAIEQFERARGEIDLVILDRSMPGLPGEQVAVYLRQIDPAVPIVLLSGQSGQATASFEAAAVLSKPVDADMLLRTLRAVLDRARGASLS